MDTFPIRLRYIRKLRKMTQEVLAERLNVTKVSVSGYENGNRSPDMSTLSRLADVLNCSVDYLLGKSDHPELDEGQAKLWNDLQLPVEEILEKYTLMWEGKEISREELEEMLMYLKARRFMSEKKR